MNVVPEQDYSNFIVIHCFQIAFVDPLDCAIDGHCFHKNVLLGGFISFREISNFNYASCLNLKKNV